MLGAFILIGLLMLVPVIAVVGAPLFGRNENEPPEARRPAGRPPGDNLLVYEDSLLELRNLEFDHQLGVVADDDHARMREHLMVEAARALASARGRSSSASGEGAISPRAPAERGLRNPTPHPDDCRTCGEIPEAGDRFCSACGAGLTTLV